MREHNSNNRFQINSINTIYLKKNIFTTRSNDFITPLSFACLKALMKHITIRTSRCLVQKRIVNQLMTKRYRSAVSGQFVKKDYAVKHPKTTVSETIKKKN